MGFRSYRTVLSFGLIVILFGFIASYWYFVYKPAVIWQKKLNVVTFSGINAREINWGIQEVSQLSNTQTTFVLTGILTRVYQEENSYWMDISTPKQQFSVFLGFTDGIIGYMEQGIEQTDATIELFFSREKMNLEAIPLSQVTSTLKKKHRTPISLMFSYFKDTNSQIQEFSSLLNDCVDNEYCQRMVTLMSEHVPATIAILNNPQAPGDTRITVPISSLISI